MDFNDKEEKSIENLTIDDKRKMVEIVKNMSKDVHLEIFYLIKKKNYDYSLNINGIFINLNDIDNETLLELKNMIIFYNKNEIKLKKKFLERYDKK